MKKQLIELLQLYSPFDEVEQKHKEQALNFVVNTSFCTSKETISGHVTASAWILSPEYDSALLTHHKKLNRWLQLGGHVADDNSIQEAAIREAKEESGIIDLRLLDDGLFDIDVHLIPARKFDQEHYHYDFRFIFHSPTKEFSISDESNGLAWVDLAEINDKDADESIVRMAKKPLFF